MKVDKKKIAKAIMREIWYDVNDRRNIRDVIRECDLDIQKNIQRTWYQIILKHLARVDSCQSLGGKTKSPTKSEAARQNGKKGGRPKKPRP